MGRMVQCPTCDPRNGNPYGPGVCRQCGGTGKRDGWSGAPPNTCEFCRRDGVSTGRCPTCDARVYIEEP